MNRLWPLLLLAGGCAFVFDGSAPDLPLVGTPFDPSQAPKLNRGPAGTAGLVLGRDNTFWITFTERSDTAEGPKRILRVMRADPPAAEEVLDAEDLIISYRAFFRTERKGEGDTASTLLSIHSAGEGEHWDVFDLPLGPAVMVLGGYDDVIAWLPLRPDNTEIVLFRRDGSFRRTLPVPAGVDPSDYEKGTFFFTYGGDWLVVRDGNDQVTLYGTRSLDTREYGVVPGSLERTTDHLLACGPGGLLTVALTGGVRTVLDERPCQRGTTRLIGRRLYYQLDKSGHGSLPPEGTSLITSETFRVPFDGSGPPEPFLDAGQRLLSFGPEETPIYTRLAPNTYVNDVTDGWFGDWRFMERGRAVSYSSGQKRLRWIERAAQASGVGDLYSARLDGAEPLRLARNVRRYNEIGDGRLLVLDNRAYRGAHNRLVLVDEERREVRWVAAAAGDWSMLPGGEEILVNVMTTDENFDIYRVRLPPREAATN
jgi:hypothetical protein